MGEKSKYDPTISSPAHSVLNPFCAVYVAAKSIFFLPYDAPALRKPGPSFLPPPNAFLIRGPNTSLSPLAICPPADRLLPSHAITIIICTRGKKPSRLL